MNILTLSRLLSGVLTVAQTVLLTLKISGTLLWPWWQVFLPLVVPFCLVGAAFIYLFLTFEK